MANEIKIKLTIDGKEAVATLDLSDQKLQKFIDNSNRAKVSNDNLGESFKRLTSYLIGFFAIEKVTGLLKDSVREFSQEEETIALLQNTVGNATKGLVEYANEMAHVTGIKDDEIMAAEKQIGDFVKDENMIKKLTKATIDFAVAKRIDLASASNLVSRMLAGESKSLGRIKLDIDENSKGAERYNQIADAMTKIWGGQAEAAGQKLTGTLGKMKNAVDNMKEAIGERLAPVITIIADKIGYMSDKAAQSSKALMTVEIIGRTLGIIFGGLTQIIVTLGTVLGGFFGIITRIAVELPNIVEGLARAASGDLLGGALLSASIDRIGASFNNWKDSIVGVQKAYAGFYNLMLNPQSKLGELPGIGGKEPPPTAGDSKDKDALAKRLAKQFEDAQKEGIAAVRKYYEEVKFEDEKYFSWKGGQYLLEAADMVAAGLEKERAQIWLNNKLKALELDRQKWMLEHKGLKPVDVGEKPDIQKGIQAGINKEKELHDDLMNSASQFGDGMTRALDRSGKSFISYLNIALQSTISIMDIFSKMSSGDKSTESGVLGIISSIFPFFHMANGGIINEPVLGMGLSSGKSYAFGEKGVPEMVMPMNRFSPSNYDSTPRRIEVIMGGEVGVGQRGLDLHGTINKRNIILKKYYGSKG